MIFFVHNAAKCWLIFDFFHLWMQQEICIKILAIIPPHLYYVGTLPCKM